MSGFYVNGTNINTLFKTGSVSASTNGGFRINNIDVKSTLKATPQEQSAIQTYFRILNSDLNTIFRVVTFVDGPFTTTASTGTYSNNYINSTNTTVLSFTTVQTVTITFLKSMTVRYLVVAGGGGGGSNYNGAGGGAGGYLSGTNYSVTANTAYTITVGGGGGPGLNGSDSVFSSFISKGGGRGASYNIKAAGSGGSGGGGQSSYAPGSGTDGQGYAGGNPYVFSGINTPGGGGGASQTGFDATSSSPGAGGAGIDNNITGRNVRYATGGAGYSYNNGTANTGNGGGGADFTNNGSGGNGGSGIVILSFIDGLYFNIYSGYFADVVTYDTGKTPTNSGSGITNFTDISGATNGVMPVNGGTNYTVVWTGTLLSNFTGDWTFGLNSDDASYMWIGANATSGYTTANATINNGGTHGMTLKTATIPLTSGQSYPIRIIFGEQAGGDDCQLYYSNALVTNSYNFSGIFV